MKLPLKTITSLFAIMFLTGCATSPRTHLTNVKNDFFDIARASVAGGPLGLGMNIKATKFLELQYDDYEAYRLGWLGRGLGLWYEESSVRTISTFSFLNNHNSSIHFKFGNTNEQLGSMANTKRGRYGSVDDNFYSTPDEFRLAAYLGYVGADIGVRPLDRAILFMDINNLK